MVRWYRSSATTDHGFKTNDERAKVRLLAVAFADSVRERALRFRDTNVNAVLAGATATGFLTLHGVCFLRGCRGNAERLRLLRLAVNRSISGSWEFLVERRPSARASAIIAEFLDYPSHPSCAQHRVHGVAKPSARPVVVLAAGANMRRGCAVDARRFLTRTHAKLQVLACHVITTVIV